MIYKADFKNPTDGTYDTIDTDKVNMIALNEEILESSSKEYKIKYTISYSDDSIKITGVIDGINAEMCSKIDPQEFTNELSRCIHLNQLADESPIVSATKEDLKNGFKDTLLLEGIIVNQVYYEAFGYLNSIGDKIGTFEKVKLLGKNKIELTHMLSIMDIENAKDLSLEFILLGNKYETQVNYDSEGIVSYSRLNVSKTNMTYDVPAMDVYSSTEDLYQARRSLISSSFVNDNTSIDEFNDLF